MTNNEQHPENINAWERGYREALLDVYLFLTGDEQALDLEAVHFNLIAGMTDAVTASSTGRLQPANAV